MVRHAIASEEKQARRNAILEAARTLLTSHGPDLPSAARIAESAGLAKGTVYLYFRSKEEIFLALLSEGLLALLPDIETALEMTQGRRQAKVTAFIAAYVDYVVRRPELLGLDAMCQVLDRNVEPAVLRESQIAFFTRLCATGICVESSLTVPSGHGVTLLMRTFALTRGLWQSFRVHEGQTSLHTGSALSPMSLDFGSELKEALTEYWHGALATRPSRLA